MDRSAPNMSHLQDSLLIKHVPEVEPFLNVYYAMCFACFVPLILSAFSHLRDRRGSQKDPRGCKKLGLGSHSNLADEQKEVYSGTNTDGGEVTWKVKSLWIYPIKSCKGVELDHGTVDGTGMLYDRQFSFAQYSQRHKKDLSEAAVYGWKFLTQRQVAKLAMVKTEMWVPDPFSPTYSRKHPNVQSGGVVVVKFPKPKSKDFSFLWSVLASIAGTQEISVHLPFHPTEEQITKKAMASENFEIWKDNPESLMLASTKTSDTWVQDLHSYLEMDENKPLALFRVSTEQPREVFRNAPRKEELGYQPIVGFQDAYPLHILNLASVRDVGRRLESSTPVLSAKNFRPNIIIAGGEAYDEDSWKRIRIGNYAYHVCCRTARCLLPNVDQITGERHKVEPNRTLKSFRKIDNGDLSSACLGMQMIPAVEDRKVIKVGDEIAVLEIGEHFYIKQ